MAMTPGGAGADGSGDERSGIVAELDAVIETAGKVAHDGPEPGSDGIRIVSGLVLQLAEQVRRLAEPSIGETASEPVTDRSPNEAEAPSEEDVSPRNAPADPARPV